MLRMLLIFAILLPACAGARWNNEDALNAKKIEMTMSSAGKPMEVEFHISPAQVPEVVRAEMDKLHPGGAFTDAEKEWYKGKLYYELSREVKGMEVEAMFTPDGELFQQEIEVSQSKVPAGVQTAARTALSGGKVKKWEEIRDGSNALLEYHVKMARGGKNYKIMISTAGRTVGVYREIPSEIEVPR
ncbi:MAG: hypothetical protein ACYTF8_01080 [Planctomycetota bacterium]|jgi:hypothetical protein